MNIFDAKLNARVHHNKFGNGTIIEINTKEKVLKILFDNPIDNKHERLIIPSYVSEILNAQQLKLKNFLDERKIEYLVHFTDEENVESISKYGLLSIDEMNSKGIKYKRNDSDRLDKHTNYISLSITHPNTIMSYHCKMTHRIGNVYIVYIDAKILYEKIKTPRIYCDRNAAGPTCRMGSHFDDLRNLFCDNISYATTFNSYRYDRIKDGRTDNETTDPQAEILFFKYIDPKYIIKIEKER